MTLPFLMASLKSSMCRKPYAARVVVAQVHLPHDPLERLGGPLRVGDDRRDQVRDALVGRQLHPLGVDEDHAHVLGRRAHHDGSDQAVNARRLTGTGGSGDEHVRHLRQVGHHIAALDVLAERHQHGVLVLGGGREPQHVTEVDHLPVGVGDLDADRGLAGDRADDPHVRAGDGVRDVLGERGDPLDLHGGSELDLVARDRRPAREAGDGGVDLELREDVRQRRDYGVVGRTARLAGPAALQEVEGGQRVGDVAGELKLLRAGGQFARSLGSGLGEVGDLDLELLLLRPRLLLGPRGRYRGGYGGRLHPVAHTDALGEVGDQRRGRQTVHDDAVQVRGGGRGDVHGVHLPVHRGLRHGGTPGAPPALREGLLLGAVRVVRLGRGTSPAPTRGQRLTPLLVVALVVLAELVRHRVVDDPEPYPELPQPPWNGVDRGGRDDEQPEDRQQHEQRYGEDLAHGVRQRGGRSPADEAAGVPYRLHAGAAGGRAAGDVHLAEHTDDERRQTDHDPAVGLGLLGVPDEPHGDDREQYRHEQVEPAEGARHDDLDEVADGATQVRPGAGGDDQAEGEQQECHAVLPVRGVEVLRTLPYPAKHRADGVGEAEPYGTDEPQDATGRAGRRPRRRGLLRRGLPGGCLLRRCLLGSGLLCRTLRGSGSLLSGLLLGCGGT
ncbi:hypothetical protein RKD27_002512 [Streptomyces sp. SAI-126]